MATIDPTIHAAHQRRAILIAVCIALMAVIGSVSGLNVAQQQVALALNASQSEVLWMINIYAITMAALLLPLGAVGDRWGRKPVLLAGLVVFGVASAAAGLAPSSEVMLAARFPDVAVLLKSMQRLGYLPRLQDVPFAVVAHIGGLVTRFAVLVGNPPDAPELPKSVTHHLASFARVPAVLTADRALSTLDNEQLARELHIRSVALPRQGPLTAKQHEVQHRAAFRRAYRWRAGIEGRISVLKRRFGLDRCRYHGDAGMERWIGFGVLAHNLRQISHSLAMQAAS